MDIDAVIDELNELAGQQDSVIYNIHFCLAGWGIIWFDGTRAFDEPRISPFDGKPMKGTRTDASLKSGMVVHRYYDTFSQMLAGERERLLKAVVAD
jgi:hypothetical protein